MQNAYFGALRHAAKALVAVFLLGALAACSTNNFPFSPVDKDKKYKVTTIAVIAGAEDDATVKLAGFVTDRMTEKSSFHVMSQADIAKRLGANGYPLDIKIDTERNLTDVKPIWFPAADKAKLNAVQAKLKVDYIYVVWNRFVRRVTVTNYNGGGSTTDYVYPAGNMLEYPGGTVVASTMSYAGSQLSILALFRDKDHYIVSALKDASEDIVSDFTDVTKSRK